MSTNLREGVAQGGLRDPVFWNGVTQLVKTALAAVLAWVLATEVFSLSQSFLAPWAALLVVHATVYLDALPPACARWPRRSPVWCSPGCRQRTRAGPPSRWPWCWSSGLLLGALPWLGRRGHHHRHDGLVVLTTGFESDVMLISRLLDTAIGVAVGLLVNVIVWPPLRRRTAATALDRIDDRIGELLVDMAAGLVDGCQDEDITEWIDRTRGPRRRPGPGVGAGAPGAGERPDEPPPFGPRDEGPPAVARAAAPDGAVRGRDPQPGPHAGRPAGPPGDLGRRLRRPWIGCSATRAGAPPPPTRSPCSRCASASRTSPRSLRSTERSAEWPIYGALIINLRNILDAMDEVAEANPIGGNRLPLRIPGGPRAATTA